MKLHSAVVRHLLLILLWYDFSAFPLYESRQLACRIYLLFLLLLIVNPGGILLPHFVVADPSFLLSIMM